jgi:hypothetical protein
MTKHRRLRQLVAAAIAASAFAVAAPASAFADECAPSTEEAIGTEVEFIMVKEGFARPNGGKITLEVKEGQSVIWQTSESVGIVAGHESSNISVTETTSNSVTFTWETTETHELDLAEHPDAARADLMAAVHLAKYGWRDIRQDCSVELRWDRIDSTIEQLGWRLVTSDGEEIWEWPPVETPPVTGSF